MTTQPKDKMRAEFEAFYIGRARSRIAKRLADWSDDEIRSGCMCPMSDGSYGIQSADDGWTSWQAACAQQSEASATLAQIAEVAACFGADWPDVDGEPEVLRRVKWAARQLKTCQERKPLTDEQIVEIDEQALLDVRKRPRRGYCELFTRGIEAAHGITAIATQGASNV